MPAVHPKLPVNLSYFFTDHDVTASFAELFQKNHTHTRSYPVFVSLSTAHSSAKSVSVVRLNLRWLLATRPIAQLLLFFSRFHPPIFTSILLISLI
jgi:hypothetical protein